MMMLLLHKLVSVIGAKDELLSCRFLFFEMDQLLECYQLDPCTLEKNVQASYSLHLSNKICTYDFILE